jgi:hypothetical protein
MLRKRRGCAAKMMNLTIYLMQKDNNFDKLATLSRRIRDVFATLSL